MSTAIFLPDPAKRLKTNRKRELKQKVQELEWQLDREHYLRRVQQAPPCVNTQTSDASIRDRQRRRNNSQVPLLH